MRRCHLAEMSGSGRGLGVAVTLCVRITLALVLVGLVQAAGGCGADEALLGKDCTSTNDQTFDIENPDTPTAFKIEQCRVDVDACTPLCTYVLDQHSISSSNGATGCDVEFEGAVTHVKASYQVFNGGPNCPVIDPPQSGGGF
jgi:hypothetical protein